jgi:hypothetical protein
MNAVQIPAILDRDAQFAEPRNFPWEGHSIISWWEMNKFAAFDFYEIAKELEKAYNYFNLQRERGDQMFAKHSRSLSPQEKLNLWHVYHAIETHCVRINLAQSVSCAQRLKEEMAFVADGNVVAVPVDVQTSHVAYRLEELDNRIKDEMKGVLFVHILPHRIKYATGIVATEGEFKTLPDIGKEIFGIEISLSNFRSAHFDLGEAGNCLAYERFTACVHHLSRIVEFGLVALAVHAGVDAKDCRNWNTALNVAHKNLREKVGTFANLTKKDEEYWSEAIGLLRNFNVAWRNPSSHIPTIYDEKATNLFTITKATMEHLGQRLAEVPMPA